MRVMALLSLPLLGYLTIRRHLRSLPQLILRLSDICLIGVWYRCVLEAVTILWLSQRCRRLEFASRVLGTLSWIRLTGTDLTGLLHFAGSAVLTHSVRVCRVHVFRGMFGNLESTSYDILVLCRKIADYCCDCCVYQRFVCYRKRERVCSLLLFDAVWGASFSYFASLLSEGRLTLSKIGFMTMVARVGLKSVALTDGTAFTSRSACV